jgi:hypothetical protein
VPPLVNLPVKQDGRARIDLPFQAGSVNYDLIRDVLSPTTVQVKYDRSERMFSVAGRHAPGLIECIA